MLSLGIDQSFTSTGIVFLTENNALRHHQIISSTKDDDVIDRAWYVASEIVKLVDMFQPDIITMEGLAFGAMGDATRNLAGLQMIIHARLRYELGKQVVIAAPQSLKKYACHGKAKKEEMFDSLPDAIKTVFETYPKSKGRFDVTDAYWASAWGINQRKEPS